LETSKSKAVAFIIAAVLTLIIVGSMVVVHEFDSGFKQFLVSLTGHHWVTKGVFAAVLFPLFSVILYFAVRSERVRRLLRSDNIWGWTVVLVAVTILFYLATVIGYVIEFFS